MAHGLGDQLSEFMETSIRENDFVLIVCTPHYKEKSDKRTGGVGYEGDIMTSEVRTQKNHRKFIPLLRSGSWLEAAPYWIQGKYYVDLRNSDNFPQNYYTLLSTLLGHRLEPPPIGSRSPSQFGLLLYEGKYSSTYMPPAPVMEVTIVSPFEKSLGKTASSVSLDVKLIVDTGADISGIPNKAIRKLEKKLGRKLPYSSIEVASFDNRRQMRRTYELDVKRRGDKSSFDRLEFLGIENNIGFLGRDFLNRYKLLLDTNSMTFKIYGK